MGPGVQAQGGGGGGGGAERQVGAATAAFTVCWLLRAVKFEGFLLFEVKASRAKGPALARGLFALWGGASWFSKTGNLSFAAILHTLPAVKNRPARSSQDTGALLSTMGLSLICAVSEMP